MANFGAYNDFNSYGTAFGDESIDFNSFINSTQSQDPFFDDQLALSPSDSYMNANANAQHLQENFMSSIPSADVSNVDYSQFDNQYPSTAINNGSFPFPTQPLTPTPTATPLSQSSPAKPSPTARKPTKAKCEPQPKPEPKKRGRKRKVHSSKSEEDASRQRFLERNRIAASKCREKKKAWMDRLEAMRYSFETEKVENMHMVIVLREELHALVDAARGHLEAGCKVDDLQECVERVQAKLVGVEGLLEAQARRAAEAQGKMVGAETPDSDHDSGMDCRRRWA